MPSWTPNWSDVRFDHAAAARAADECERAATILRDRTADRMAEADRAREEWEGRYRRDFDQALVGIRSEADALEGALRGLAADIRLAADRARAEQSRREAERDRWTREKAAEDAAAPPVPVGARGPL